MTRKHNKIVPLFFLLIIVSCQGQENSARYDWPQWRGPTRNGVAEGVALPTVLPKQPKPLWRVEVGEGHCGPVVVGEMGGGDRHEQLALGETPKELSLAPRRKRKAAPRRRSMVSGPTKGVIAGTWDTILE